MPVPICSCIDHDMSLHLSLSIYHFGKKVNLYFLKIRQQNFSKNCYSMYNLPKTGKNDNMLKISNTYPPLIAGKPPEMKERFRGFSAVFTSFSESSHPFRNPSNIPCRQHFTRHFTCAIMCVGFGPKDTKTFILNQVGGNHI